VLIVITINRILIGYCYPSVICVQRFILQSMAESVVSVIERQIPSRPGSAAGSGRISQMSQQLPASPTARVSPQFSTPEISLTSEAGFGARVLQPKLERKTFSSQPSLSTLVGRSQVFPETLLVVLDDCSNIYYPG